MESFDMCWLPQKKFSFFKEAYVDCEDSRILKQEIMLFFNTTLRDSSNGCELIFSEDSSLETEPEGFTIVFSDGICTVKAKTEIGLLYGFYELLRICSNPEEEAINRKEESIVSNPKKSLRMLNHWDNISGDIERGYAGRSIFFEEDNFLDLSRTREYARLLCSIGINGISINNVNVHRKETSLIREPYLDNVKEVAEIFMEYNIKLYLAINFAAPIVLGDLDTADPCDDLVKKWWRDIADNIYSKIPEFGGFIVKADSEGEPGPFSYGRTHSDGANMLAAALKKYDGKLIWRCFVYNCNQDWRDRKTDRARAAYDNFKGLDGEFADNAFLQIKYGPMDFQIREPISPLFGAMDNTNQIIEMQITQEYTGQQKHICWLVPVWKQALEFDTYSKGQGPGGSVSGIVKGISAVAGVGRDDNWMGHKLAQANLYGFGRLCWDYDLSEDEILTEWIRSTFDLENNHRECLFNIMKDSSIVYENYTAPLGVGWMVRPGHHYGPDIDGYEYDRWGTYHFSDRDGIGVDRTTNGTGYVNQYYEPNLSMYNDLDTCPDELLLFFHHVPYTHVLKSGKTVIQHIYDTHFEGVEKVESYTRKWKSFEGKVSPKDFENVSERLKEQLRCAREWRDQINTYFYRKSGIPDENGRKIY